ncbi:MAG: hypothetical protein WDM85_04960 [Caulobacteraceae bacterium]
MSALDPVLRPWADLRPGDLGGDAGGRPRLRDLRPPGGPATFA